MNLRGCEQRESSKGPGAGVLEPRGGQGLRKSCSRVPRACSEQPAAHAGFGANASQTFAAKFRLGILSQQGFGKRRGSLRSSAGCQQPMCCSFRCDGHPPGPARSPPAASRPGRATSQPQSARGLGRAVTACDSGSKERHPRSLPARDRPQLYLITN